VTIRSLVRLIAIPPVRRRNGASSLSHVGRHADGNRRSLTTMSAARHAAISWSDGNWYRLRVASTRNIRPPDWTKARHASGVHLAKG
jgi:hypothetical protein